MGPWVHNVCGVLGSYFFCLVSRFLDDFGKYQLVVSFGDVKGSWMAAPAGRLVVIAILVWIKTKVLNCYTWELTFFLGESWLESFHLRYLHLGCAVLLFVNAACACVQKTSEDSARMMFFCFFPWSFAKNEVDFAWIWIFCKTKLGTVQA